MSFGMREFSPPLDLQARLGDMICLVVVARHDRHRLGQRLQPRDELRRVVVPQIVLGAAAQRRKGEFGIRRLDRLAEALTAFVREVDAPRAVEGEVAEALLQKILGGHPARRIVRSGDVGDGGEAFLEVLCDGYDPVFAEQFDVVGVVELADHGVGLHAQRPLHDGFDAEFVAYRQRQAAQAPCLRRVVRIARHAEEQFSCVRFGKVGQENYACHRSGSVRSTVKVAFFLEIRAVSAIFRRQIGTFRGAGNDGSARFEEVKAQIATAGCNRFSIFV